SCTMLEAETGMPTGHPGKAVSLHGSQFATAGNTFVIEQRDAEDVTRRYELSGSQLTYESPTRIDTRLPAALLTDREAFIYVVDAAGRETEEQMFYPAPQCLDCGPQINACEEFSTGSAGELPPGTVISIHGQFRPAR